MDTEQRRGGSCMKGELDNIRAWGTYLSTIKNDCDVIMGATFKIEDDEKSGGYTVTVVGYPGVFTNWHTATTRRLRMDTYPETFGCR